MDLKKWSVKLPLNWSDGQMARRHYGQKSGWLEDRMTEWPEDHMAKDPMASSLDGI